jgi:hypothetical protein
MRRVFLGAPPVTVGTRDETMAWVINSLTEIEKASYEDIATVSDEFTVTNPVPTRSLNVSTATANDVAKVLGTLLVDLQNRGSKRG